MLEQIKKELADCENEYYFATEDVTRYLISIIEKCLAYEKHANCNFCGGGIERICNNLDPIE